MPAEPFTGRCAPCAQAFIGVIRARPLGTKDALPGPTQWKELPVADGHRKMIERGSVNCRAGAFDPMARSIL